MNPTRFVSILVNPETGRYTILLMVSEEGVPRTLATHTVVDLTQYSTAVENYLLKGTLR